MSGLFDVLTNIIKGILDLFPRFLLVRSTHKAVGFRRGTNIKVYEPGFFKNFYWPFWEEIELYPVERQTLNLPQQTLTTKDDKTVQIDTVIVYTISDIAKAFTKQYDLNDTIRDMSLVSNRRITMESTYDEMKTDEFYKRMLKGIKKTLSQYGVHIEVIEFTSFAQTKMYTVSSMGGYTPVPEVESDS